MQKQNKNIVKALLDQIKLTQQSGQSSQFPTVPNKIPLMGLLTGQGNQRPISCPQQLKFLEHSLLIKDQIND